MIDSATAYPSPCDGSAGGVDVKRNSGDAAGDGLIIVIIVLDGARMIGRYPVRSGHNRRITARRRSTSNNRNHSAITRLGG